MKKTKPFLMACVVLCSTAFAAPKPQSVQNVMKPNRPISQAAASHSESSDFGSGLSSESSSSVLGKLQLSAQGGATVGSMTTGVINTKVAYKLPVRQTPVYTEVGLSTLFNTKGLIIPFDFGGRVAINLSDLHSIQPFVHASMGPAFATTGQAVRFHMFAGPGMIYKMANNDLRFDMGVTFLGDKASFQMVGGVAL